MAFNGAIAIDQRYAIQDISPEAPEQELLDAVHFTVASELMHTSCMYDNDVCLDQTAVYNKLTAGVSKSIVVLPEALLATAVPDPMATPISAFFSAGASLTPSPVCV